MNSSTAQALSLRFPPLGIRFAQAPPAGAAEAGKTMCSMTLLAQAAKGQTVALRQGGGGCPGADQGFGLAPFTPEHFPGGRECFLRFLSVGNQDWERGQAVIQQMTAGGAPKILVREFAEGEGFLKSPELAAQWLEQVPAVEPEGPWVVIQPLSTLAPEETPKVVTFLADPDQLSALTVLANFARGEADTVRIPFASGCASVGRLPFFESTQARPKAVVGLIDISSRFYLRQLLGNDILAFTVPWPMFQEIDRNVPESFLTRFTWRTMTEK